MTRLMLSLTCAQWGFLVGVLIHPTDAHARTALHAPVYIENAKPKRVVKKFRKKSNRRCIVDGKWEKEACR